LAGLIKPFDFFDAELRRPPGGIDYGAAHGQLRKVRRTDGLGRRCGILPRTKAAFSNRRRDDSAVVFQKIDSLAASTAPAAAPCALALCDGSMCHSLGSSRMTAAHLFACVPKLTLFRWFDGIFTAGATLALCHLHLSHTGEPSLQPALEAAQGGPPRQTTAVAKGYWNA